jgi:hypothetical protein
MTAFSGRSSARRLLLFVVFIWLIIAASSLEGQYIVEVGQTAVLGVPTGVGYVNVTIYPTFAASEGYLNVVSGPVSNTGSDSWLVQNFPIPMAVGPGFFGPGSPMLFGATFDFTTHPLDGSVNLWVSFTPAPLVVPDLTAMTVNLGLTVNTEDTQDLHTTVPGYAGGAGRAGPPLLPARPMIVAMRGLPLLPADSPSPDDTPKGVRDDIPGIKQKDEECAPTATAQSLKWLHNNKKITLPKQFQDEKAGDRGLIDELKKDMLWVEGKGVQPANFTPGKQKFIDKYKLPLTVEQGGKDNGDGTLDFIKVQIAKGQDVELWLKYDDGTEHVVTVAGTHDEKTDSGTKHYIYIRDPLSPEEGTVGYELTGKGDKAGKVLNEYHHVEKDHIAKMMFAVAESPK